MDRTSPHGDSQGTPAGAPGRPGAPGQWLRLVLGLFLIWLLSAVVAPVFEGIPIIGRFARTMQEQEIAVPAWYYTGVEQTFTGSNEIGDAIKRSPDRPLAR